HRKKVEGLKAGYHPHDASLGTGLVLGKGEGGNRRVGIELEVVRIGVMVVVAIDPPAAADAHESGNHESEHVVAPGAGEDLAVAGVVAEKPHLGENEAGENGGRELYPDGFSEKDDRESRDIESDVNDRLGREKEGLPVEDAVLREQAFEVVVVV